MTIQHRETKQFVESYDGGEWLGGCRWEAALVLVMDV